MRDIDEIIIHCTATRPEWWKTRTTNQKVAEVRRWHVEENGWADIGYATLIDRNGTRAAGRDLNNDGDTFDDIGAHTKGRNSRSIGIALFGGHGSAANGKFEDNFTPEQDAELRKLIAELKERFPAIKKVSGHNEYANKACPGFNVKHWLEQAPERESLAESRTIQMSQVAKAAATAGPVVGYFADMPWQNLLILSALTLVVLMATGVIDVERVRKWRRGVR
jgi:hypothetical protein